MCRQKVKILKKKKIKKKEKKKLAKVRKVEEIKKNMISLVYKRFYKYSEEGVYIKRNDIKAKLTSSRYLQSVV